MPKRGSSSSKRKEPEYGYQNFTLNEIQSERCDFAGRIEFTPEFLEAILVAFEEGALDDDDPKYPSYNEEKGTINLSIFARWVETKNNGEFISGNVAYPNGILPEEERRQSGGSKKRGRRK